MGKLLFYVLRVFAENILSDHKGGNIPKFYIYVHFDKSEEVGWAVHIQHAIVNFFLSVFEIFPLSMRISIIPLSECNGLLSSYVD